MGNPNAFAERLGQVCAKLNEHEQVLFAEDLLDLQQRQSNLADALAREDDNGRLLRIGIIGSVKAGKSTFLNALLFDGQAVLPSAATPMTASLTRLQYAESQYARFTFYSYEDWQNIEEQANKATETLEKELMKLKREPHVTPYEASPDEIEQNQRKRLRSKLPDVQQACLDLIDGARNNHLDLHCLLGSSKDVPVADITQILGSLKEHVGSKGQLTPIVRHVELGIRNPLLKDLEIVDTPGLNDPVRSRSAETYKALAQCDTVFLLSRASQFLTESDIKLYKNTLRENGISHKVIVATQMDLGALNERGKVQFFEQAFKRTLRAVKNAYNEYIKDGSNLLCVSSLLSSCAYKIDNGLPLSEEEQHALESLRNFQDAPASSEDMRQVANMSAVHDQLKNTRDRKDTIILEHKKNLVDGARHGALENLRALESALIADKNLLLQSDYTSLNRKKENISKAIDAVRYGLGEMFTKMESRVGQVMADLSQRLISNIGEFTNLDVNREVNEEERSHTTGMLFWKKTHYRTVQTVVHTAELADVLGQLRDYAAKSQKDINSTFKTLLPIDEVAENIKKKLLPIIRTSEVDFDEDFILLPLKSILHKLTVPKFIFDNSPFNEHLVNNFDGTVEGKDIHRLKIEAELAFQALGKEMCDSMMAIGANVRENLLKQSVVFADDMGKAFLKKLDKIQSQLNDRTANLQAYDNAVVAVRECSRMLTKDLE